MNEQLAKSLTEVVDLAKDGIIKGAEILQVQVPDLVNQILRYYSIMSIIGIIIGIILGIICCVLAIQESKRNKYSELTVFFIAFSIVSGLASVVIIPVSLYYLIQIYVAPKLFLIQYLKGLL